MNKSKAGKFLESLNKLGGVRKIKESIESIDKSDWDQFKTIHTKLGDRLLKGNGQEDYDKISDIFDKLDKPLAKAIDYTLGTKFDQNKIEQALVDGERSQGTEPVAALSYATSLLQDALRKLGK